jgi:hypothetical protein
MVLNMTIFVKTVQASELPAGWQVEMGLQADSKLRVAIEELPAVRPAAETERLLKQLSSIVPVTIDGGVTDFIRAERTRLDERNGSTN